MARALIWYRRDLRLVDHAPLHAALAAGLAPVPVYVHAPHEDGEWTPGAASRVWRKRSLVALDEELRRRGSRLLLRRGDSLAELEKLAGETGAAAVFWQRQYEPEAAARDAVVGRALRRAGLRAEGLGGALLVEPGSVNTASGEPYRVFTPYWKKASVALERLGAPLPAPMRLPGLPDGLESLPLEALELDPPGREPPWDAGVLRDWRPGEAGAAGMLEAFVEGAAHGYRRQRDFLDRIGTSRLSPHLHFGEISPRQVVSRLQRERWSTTAHEDVSHFLRELGWREFSHHLLHHFPHSAGANLDPRFDGFDWAKPDPRALAAWRRGRTGVPIVDAAMRELWATGWMHNRARMIVASFLTKNLRYHWLHGARWFWDTLLDADLANNTQGWQWSAGTGTDAAPYFRIFNPVVQAQRFDPRGRYLRRWLPELAALPEHALFAPWRHPSLLAAHAPRYPARPVVDLAESRRAALTAWHALRRSA